jgi:transcriptional regulator with XRE-family HTH domain
VPIGSEDAHFLDLMAALRARRQALGLSQIALEERLGFTRGHIGKYETGIRRPTGWNLSNWVLALGGVLTATFKENTDHARPADQPRRAQARQAVPPAAAARR